MSFYLDNFNPKNNQRNLYAVLQNSTTATVTSKKIMETNEKETGVRQENKFVFVESKLVKN